MKIVDRCDGEEPTKVTSFKDVIQGEAISLLGASYIRIAQAISSDGRRYNLVNLSTGNLGYLGPDERVTPLPNAKFVKGV